MGRDVYDQPAPDDLPVLHYLRSVDLARNRRRHYLVGVQRDLLGNLVVLRCWGRIGARGGMRQRTTPAADLAQATRIIRGVLRERQRHGYVEVTIAGGGP